MALAVLALAALGAGCGSKTVKAKSTTSAKSATSPTSATSAAATRPARPSSQQEHALLKAISTARTCLDRHGMRASGGRIEPQGSPTSPDGELIVGRAAAGAFIAFYTSVTRAEALEPELKANAVHAHAQLDRRGTATVLLVGRPTTKLRDAVDGCTH